MSERAVEIEQAAGAETAREAFTRQAQTITDRGHTHAHQGLAQARRPVETGERKAS